MLKCCKQSIKALGEDIKKTEEEIKKVIDNDEKLKELFSIIEFVPGVGKITATEIVINTNEFRMIMIQENMHVILVLLPLCILREQVYEVRQGPVKKQT